jgi:hypothetical protein
MHTQIWARLVRGERRVHIVVGIPRPELMQVEKDSARAIEWTLQEYQPHCMVLDHKAPQFQDGVERNHATGIRDLAPTSYDACAQIGNQGLLRVICVKQTKCDKARRD